MKLNNNLEIPQMGLGTFMLTPGEAERSVLCALGTGYRLIDTANAYVNERAVGMAIKKSGVKRENIFLSTKLWATEYENENAVDETLDRLGLNYVDLLFIHQPAGNYIAGYEQLIKAQKQGKAKCIGISNFEGKYIAEILEQFNTVPQVIQVEAHPYFTQEELRKTTDKHGIKIMSWYPLGHGDGTLLGEETLKELAQKHSKTVAQIILRWHIQMGFIVIPGSKSDEHIKENFEVLNFSLSDADMAKIAALNKNERYYTRTDEALRGFANYKPQYEKE